LFDIPCDSFRDLRIPVDRKRDGATGEFFDYFGGLMFKDGYFYKNVSLKTIDAKGIEPSLDELQKFQKPGEDGLEAMGLPPAAAKTRGQFMKGDTVVVVEGDLRNLMGIVEKVDDDSVFIRPKNKDLKVIILSLLGEVLTESIYVSFFYVHTSISMQIAIYGKLLICI
jgi:transcription elongation factor SPT5